MAKRNVCILESFFSLGATEEGRWQRSCSIAALILLIRDRSRALAVCLCLLKPVSRGFLRRLLFPFRASLLPIFFRSREFSTTILVWYSREWSLLSNLGVQWTERDWPSCLEFVFKPRNALSLSRSNWPNFLLACRAVCQPKWNWPPFTRTVECALNEDPNLQSEGVDSRIELQRRSSGFQLWNQIICNQISGHKNETTLLRTSKKTVTGGQREASVVRRIYFQHGRWFTETIEQNLGRREAFQGLQKSPAWVTGKSSLQFFV